MTFKALLRSVLLVVVATVLFACSSGGDENVTGVISADNVQKMSGNVIYGSNSNTTVKIYGEDGVTLIGEVKSDDGGYYEFIIPISNIDNYYNVEASIENQEKLSAYCSHSERGVCHVTPYSTLVDALSQIYSGTRLIKQEKALLSMKSSLGLISGLDPFVDELSGSTVTEADLAVWREALSGRTITDWNSLVISDISDTYLDTQSSPVIFPDAKIRSLVTVTESDYAIDKNTNITITDSVDSSETLISLPNGTTIKRELLSLSTEERGDSVGSSDYMSDIVYVESIDFSSVSGEAEDIVESIVYNSFNIGDWKGKLDSQTTVLSKVFTTNITLLFLPDSEKNTIANTLIDSDIYVQAVEQHKSLVSYSTDKNEALFEDFLELLSEVALDKLDATQLQAVAKSVSTSLKSTQLELGLSAESVSASVTSAKGNEQKQTSLLAEKITTQDDPFEVFQGLWLDYSDTSDELNLHSRSSLWYSLESGESFKNKDFLSNLDSVNLIDPKSGFVSTEDLNIVKNVDALGDKSLTQYGAITTTIGMDFMDSSLEPVETVIYRNDPNSYFDLPQIMNGLLVAKVVIEKASGLKSLDFHKSNKVKSVLKALDSLSDFKKAHEDKAKLFASILSSGLLLAELGCGDDVACSNQWSNTSKLIGVTESFFGSVASAGDAENIDPNHYDQIAREIMAYLAKSLTGSTGRKQQTINDKRIARLKPVLFSELVIRPAAKFIGQDLSGSDAYNMARKLYNKKDNTAKRDFLKIWSKALAKGFSAKKLLNISLSTTASLKHLLSLKNVYGELKKLPFKDLLYTIVEKSLLTVASQANDIAISGALSIAKNITPAKVVDGIMAVNELGAIAYDWVTDPSLIRLTMQKQDEGLNVDFSIPNLDAIRYLKVPLNDSKVVSMRRPIYGKNIWNYDQSTLSLLGADDQDNHYLVMSGFKASVENQTVFQKNDTDTINRLMDNESIEMFWHVKRFDNNLLSQVIETERLTESGICIDAFNNNCIKSKLSNTFFWYTDAIKSMDQNLIYAENPIYPVLLAEKDDRDDFDHSNYNMLDFTEFYKNEAGDETDYPLQHKTPGVYSDYTSISFKTDLQAQVFSNTINMYVLPDLEVHAERLKLISSVYEGDLSNELQLSFSGSDDWNSVAPDGLNMLLRYRSEGRFKWTESIELENVANTSSVLAYTLPSGVPVSDIEVFLYNDVFQSYIARSGKSLISTLLASYTYKERSADTPIIHLKLSDLQSSDTSMLTVIDSDKDGLADIWDAYPVDARYQFDSDKDGMADSWEEANQLNELNPDDAALDTDIDTVSNLSEFHAGSNPNKSDTDDDLIPDAWELLYGFLLDVDDAGEDFDGDGVSNLEEYFDSTHPLDAKDFLRPLVAPVLSVIKTSSSSMKFSWQETSRSTNYFEYCFAIESIPAANGDLRNCEDVEGGTLVQLSSDEMSEREVEVSGLAPNNTYYIRAIAADWREDNKIGAEDIYSPLSAEVTVNLDEPETVELEDALVAHYKFEGNLNDSTEYQNHGVAETNLDYAQGVDGKAVYLNGQGDYIRILNNDEINLTSLSLSLWSKTKDFIPSSSDPETAPHQMILFKQNQYEFGVFNSGIDHDYLEEKEISFAYGSDWTFLDTNVYAIANRWEHYVVNISPTSAQLYVDGVLAKDVNTSNTMSKTLNDLLIGARDNGGAYSPRAYFDGWIDDLRIYNRGLNETEVKTLYSSVGSEIDNQKLVKLLGASTYSEGQSIVSDADGNMYVTGRLSDSLFDGEASEASNGFADIFVVKYNDSGERLWTRRLAGSDQDVPYSIELTSANRIIVSGHTWNEDLSDHSNSSNQSEWPFITVFDTNGEQLWSKLLGGEGADLVRDVTSDGDGNIYITGMSYGNYEGTDVNGQSDVFVSKLNAHGNVIWSEVFGGASWEIPYDIKTDSMKNIYITGETYTTSFDSQVESDHYDSFLLKLNADGSKSWVKTISPEGTDSDSAVGHSISLAEEGKVNVVGLAGASQGSTFDGHSLISGGDYFSIKYDTDGNKLSSIILGFGNPAGYAVFGEDGNIYVATYNGINSFEGYSSMGLNDIYVVKFDSEGNKALTKQFGGSGNDYIAGTIGGIDHRNGIFVNKNGIVYLTGSTQNLYGNNQFEGLDNNASSQYDMFFIRHGFRH